MKTIFRLLATLSFLLDIAAAQERPPMGFIRIVNAISPGSGKAAFIIDGENLHKQGYGLGQTTGGYAVNKGARNIEVRKDGLETGKTKLVLGEGETMTLIAFAELLPAKNADDPPQWAIKLLRLKQQEVGRGFRLSIVSVCNPAVTEVELILLGKGRSQKVSAKRLDSTKVDLGPLRGEILVKAGNRLLTTVSPDSRGNYVVILYENAGGKPDALYYYDPKFVIAG